MNAIRRGAQRWVFVAGVFLMTLGVEWSVESLRQGHAVAWLKSVVQTGFIAWACIGYALLGGAFLVVSSWRRLRSSRGMID